MKKWLACFLLQVVFLLQRGCCYFSAFVLVAYVGIFLTAMDEYLRGDDRDD